MYSRDESNPSWDRWLAEKRATAAMGKQFGRPSTKGRHMKIEIEVTPDEVVAFGEIHSRPVSISQATIGIQRASETAGKSVQNVKAAWVSRALDYARGADPKA